MSHEIITRLRVICPFNLLRQQYQSIEKDYKQTHKTINPTIQYASDNFKEKKCPD